MGCAAGRGSAAPSATCSGTIARMATRPPSRSASGSASRPADRPADPRWPTAASWLADGPGKRSVDVAVVGIPAFATSISPTGAHATPAAVRRMLARCSTWCASRRVDLADPEDGLAPLDVGDVEDPDLDEGEWRTQTLARSSAQQARLVIAIG